MCLKQNDAKLYLIGLTWESDVVQSLEMNDSHLVKPGVLLSAIM